MKRLIEKIVFSGLVMSLRFATCPRSRSPVLVKATTEGVVLPPSSLGMTLGSPPSMTATTEFVVPRSMPIVLPMLRSPGLSGCALADGRPHGFVFQPLCGWWKMLEHLIHGFFQILYCLVRLVRYRVACGSSPNEVLSSVIEHGDDEGFFLTV